MRLGLFASAALAFRRFTTAPVMSAVKVLVPIADFSEEIETSCITDTLVRAGAAVTVASVAPEGRMQVTMSRGLKIVADAPIAECTDTKWDAIVLPGGMPGAEHLRDCATLTAMLKAQRATGLVAAICASPAVVLKHHDLLPAGDAATCYPAPAFKEKLESSWAPSATAVGDGGRVLTSQGPGTSLQFALHLVEMLFSKEKADEIAAQMLIKRPLGCGGA